MKLAARIFTLTMLVLFSVGTALAQDSHIVTYAGDPDASAKRPDFKGALIAIDFPDPALKVTSLFRRLGVKRFNVGKNPCVVGETVVCVRVTVGNPSQIASSGTTSSYGGRGGFSMGGSFSGQDYPVTLSVFLVVYNPEDGGNRPTIPLGQATCEAYVGSGSSYSSSYGSRGGGMYSSTETDGLDPGIGNAVRQDLNILLLKGSWNIIGHPLKAVEKFGAMGTPAGWVPGANATVRQYFAQ